MFLRVFWYHKYLCKMAKKLDLLQVHTEDYGSEFEYDSEVEKARARRLDLTTKPKHDRAQVASSQLVTEEYDKEERRRMRYHILSMDAYSRHKKFINDYLMYFGGSKSDFKRDTSRDKTDLDVIRENHRFLWSDDDRPEETWEKRLAKKYYDKLFKEYCIADLSRYKENKIALRWQVEKEVVLGKGQFVCGNKTCQEREGLRTWEVNFGYVEHGQKKNALVKLRLCPECSYKLNYHHSRREITRKKQRSKNPEKPAKRQKTESSEKSNDMNRLASTSRSTEDEGHAQNEDRHDDRESSKNRSEDKDKDTEDSDNPWSGPVKIMEEKSREEEFEEYFEDMFV